MRAVSREHRCQKPCLFPSSLSPFPHMCFLLFFWSNPRHSCHWAGVTQHRLDQSRLLSKASLKCRGGTVSFWRHSRDVKAGRCMPHLQHFPASSPPPSSSFTSFAPSLSYPSNFILLHFFHSPAISSCFLCHPSVHILMTGRSNSSLFPSWGEAEAH